MKFGNTLKLLRTGQKMTQQQLATRLGVAKSVVSYYESGDRFPSYDVLIGISRTFHVSVDYLLGIEKRRTVDVSDLDEDDIAVIIHVVEALRKKHE